MKMMRLLSSRARQNVTYLCQNSIAWSNSSDEIHENTIKVLTDDEIELHGHSKHSGVFLKVISDECQVCINDYFFMFPRNIHLIILFSLSSPPLYILCLADGL